MAKKKKKAAAKKSPTKKVKKKAAAKKAPAAKKPAAAPSESLGRPKVTGDEQLYHLFHHHYHARQVFEFLGVETVRELEQYSPQEIVRRLTQPVRETIEVIRRVLAEKNRHLADDLEFALQYQAEHGVSDE